MRHGKAQIDDASGKTLDAGDLNGIAGADLARQVVVDSPGKTGCHDKYGAPAKTRDLTAPGQDQRAAKNGTGPEQQTAVDRFMEDKPGDDERADALKIEKQ